MSNVTRGVATVMRGLAFVLVAVTLGAPGPVELAAQGAIRGGPSLADLIGADVTTDDGRTGLNAGGGLTLLTLGPLTIGPELYYAQKGADRARLASEGSAFLDEFGLDYVEVPLLARIGFGVPGLDWADAYVQGGPALAWRLNCSIRTQEGGGAALSEDCAFGQFDGVDAVVDSADRGALFGAGLFIPVMNLGAVNFDARMVRGLARLDDGAGGPDVRNRAFSFMIGYAFDW
jgi:hypothetical protein